MSPPSQERIEKTLSNNIPVIFQHYDGMVASLYWWVKVGSADEEKGEEGFAHFLEHMHFKDTDAKSTGRSSLGKLARAVESLGGDINAYTTFDHTVYHVTCAEQHLEKILLHFGEMAKHSPFLKSDFDSEKEVILEELKGTEDSSQRKTFQSLLNLSYPKHPYGRPVIGYKKTLVASTHRQLERFYKRHYVASNMGLIVVGPMQESGRLTGVMRRLEKAFGSKVISNKKYVPTLRKGDPQEASSVRFKIQDFDIQSAILAISVRVPNLDHEDVPALEILSGILGSGQGSRLYRKLFFEKQCVTSVTAGLYVPKDPGLFYLYADIPKKEDVFQVCEAAYEVIDQFMKDAQAELIGEDEIHRIVTNIESDRYYATQSSDGMASRLGFAKFSMGDLDFDREFIEQLKKVTQRDLYRVAKKYFNHRRMSGVVTVPKGWKGIESGPLVKLTQKFFPASASSRSSKNKTAAKSKRLHVFQLPSGMKCVHHYRPSSPLFSIHASVLGGLRLEDPHQAGVSSLTAVTWNKGTEGKDHQEINRIVEGHAASLDGFSGKNSMGLRMTGIARDFSLLSDLFREVLLEASFSEEHVQHSIRLGKDLLQNMYNHSEQLCSKLFAESLFETHPYGRLSLGSEASLSQLKASDFSTLHRNWIRPERLVVSVSGNVSEAEVKEFAESIEKHSFDPAGAFSEQIEAEAPLLGPRWAERKMDREQLHIITGGLGTTLSSKDRYALRLLENIMGGQSGRLFVELREKKGLAYSVAPISSDGIEAGYVGNYIGCSPSKREESLKGIQKVYEDFARKGPTEKEMKAARESYVGSFAMDLQSESALAGHYGLMTLYGLGFQNSDQIRKRVERVSAEQVRKVCQKYFVDRHLVTSIVG